MAIAAGTPRGVWITAGFFFVSGLLDAATSLAEQPHPLPFGRYWEILCRSLLHVLVAAGLWHRRALCRSVALIYCLATLATYVFALGLAFAHAPVRFPPSVVIQSIFQIPSCLLLIPYLRSTRAAELFPKALFGK